jgi:NAD(P)-dependent dehydrogenase (short-subunit alcohol dehydrogenase family)
MAADSLMESEQMSNSLEGKVAIVTAGANGIGEGSAVSLAELGADIVIGDIDQANGERVCERIRGLGRRAELVIADMMKLEEARALIRTAFDRMGAIDILVNNAGGVRPRAFVDQNESNWHRVIDLNLMSMLGASHEAAKVMRDHGAIVNVASTEALRAAPGFSIYSACKAAMSQFTKTLALELAPRGIRVNCIAPDLVETPGLAPHMATDPVGIDIRNRHVPLGRMASIAEAGSVVAFLASPASSWVTGVTIPVDGGITAAGGWHFDTNHEWRLAT